MKLTLAMKKEMCEYVRTLIKEEKYKNLDEVAKKYNVSVETCRRAIICGGVVLPKSRVVINFTEPAATINTAEVQLGTPVPEKEKKQLFTEVKVSKKIKCITCSERHVSPAGLKSIFGSAVTSEQMFDFAGLESTAIKFIDDNIEFIDGKSFDSIELYITGLTMLTTAVISACSKRKVNLSLMHYNRDEKKYERQIIFDDNSCISSPIINTFKGNLDCGKFYQYKDCNIFDIKDKFYLVKKIEFTLRDKYNPKVTDYYVCSSFEDSFEMFSRVLKLSKIIKDSRVVVSLMEGTIVNNALVFSKDGTISHTYANI